MVQIRHIVALGVCWIALAQRFGAPSARALAGGQGAIVTGNPAPSPDQIHSLIMRAVENQHRDDRALEEFERTEHVVTRRGENAEIVTDLTTRVLPSETGNIKLQMAENGVAVSPELYRHELEFAVSALDLAMHPNDRYKEDLAKFERRRRDHADLVDTATKAFRVTWAGRETRTDSTGVRTLMKLLLEPDPNYKPINRFAASFQHVHATLWVDEAQAQFARLEADIATDITFGGGVAGKVYHGGHVVMEQEEVAPGIWLPALYTYDLDGRKFLFAFAIHERTEVTRYRRVGPPPQAIEILRNELNNITAVTPAR
jgi:hypothetical protein